MNIFQFDRFDSETTTPLFNHPKAKKKKKKKFQLYGFISGHNTQHTWDNNYGYKLRKE